MEFDCWPGSSLTLILFPVVATTIVAIMVGIGALLRKLGFSEQLKAIERTVVPFQARVNQAFREQAFSILRGSYRNK